MFNVNMDYKKTFSLDEFKKTMTRVENIASLIGLIGLFLPYRIWAYTTNYVSGYKWFFLEMPLFLLIPLLLLIIIFIRPTCKSKTKLSNIKIFTAFFIIISSLYVFFRYGYTNIGLYVVLFSGILILLGTLEKFQLNNALPPIEEDKVSNTDEAK